MLLSFINNNKKIHPLVTRAGEKVVCLEETCTVQPVSVLLSDAFVLRFQARERG